MQDEDISELKRDAMRYRKWRAAYMLQAEAGPDDLMMELRDAWTVEQVDAVIDAYVPRQQPPSD